MSTEKNKKTFKTILVGILILSAGVGTGCTPSAPNRQAKTGDQFTTEEQAEIDKFIAEHGSDVKAVDEKGRTLLYKAVGASGSEAVVKYLVSQGADVHIKGKHTLLFYTRNPETIRFLVAQGVDVNAVVMEGAEEFNYYTVLHNVISEKNLEIAELLVELGADVNACNGVDDPPLITAAKENDIDIVKFLVSKGANVHSRDSGNNVPLHYAASSGNIELARFLISKGVDVDAKNNFRYTPLHWAAGKNKNVAFIEFLVSQGADVHAKSDIGDTPLIRAARGNNMEAARFLVSQGADVNAKNSSNGETALRLVLWNKDFVQFLLSEGADVTVVDRDGNTLLHLLADEASRPRDLAGIYGEMQNGDFAFAKFLISKGVDVNAKNKNGRTPLHSAAVWGTRIEVIRFLISEGADVNAKDKDGKTPLDLAKDMKREAVIEYLESIE